MSLDRPWPVLPSSSATALDEGRGARADARVGDAVWWARRLSLALAIGVILGIVTQRSIGLGAAVDQAFAMSTGPWAIVAALVGRWAPDVKTAVVTSTICLWSATIAFYAVGGPLGDGGTPGLWLAVIVIVGPALGWLGRVSSAHGIAGSLAVGVIAGWLVGEALHMAFGHAGNWSPAPWDRTLIQWQAHEVSSRWLGVAVNAIAAACWLIASRGPRRLAAAAVVPMTAIAAAALTAAGPLLGPTVR